MSDRLPQPHRPPRDCSPPTRYLIGGVTCGLIGSLHLDERTWAALEEIAWDERTSKQKIVEELVVAYLRDRFPSRTIPTREEVRYGVVPAADDEEDEPELADGVRHYEHNELHWRSGTRREPRPLHTVPRSENGVAG